MSARYLLTFIILIILGCTTYYLGYQERITSNLPVVNSIRSDIGLVNLNRVKTETEVYKKFAALADEQHQQAHDQFSQKEGEIRKIYEQLKQEQEKNPQGTADFQTRKDDFEKMVAKFQQQMTLQKEDFEKYFTTMKDKIDGFLNNAIGSVAQNSKLNLIIDSSLVLYQQGHDVTDSLIKKLNELTKDFVFDPIQKTNPKKETDKN